MEKDGVYYVDHSILSTVDACEEKARLLYKERKSPLDISPPLVFGSAIHAGVAEYYISRDSDKAQIEFYKVAKDKLADESDEEKRTIQRGSLILNEYMKKYNNKEPQWADILDESGKPMVEKGGSLYFMDYHGKPVMYVFKIDRIRKNRIDGRAYNWETKTTSSSPKFYANQVRPNHQITGYYWASKEMLHLDLAGTIFDIIYVSDRKIGGKYPNGVDVENDFMRVPTNRSATDVEEFLYDLREGATRYLDLFTSEKRRWRRSAPAACYAYGGCWFREACSSNLNPQIMANKFGTSTWHPWKTENEEDKNQQEVEATGPTG